MSEGLNQFHLPLIAIRRLAANACRHRESVRLWGAILTVASIIATIGILLGASWMIIPLLVFIPTLLLISSWDHQREINAIISKIEDDYQDEGYKLFWSDKLEPKIRALELHELPHHYQAEIQRRVRLAKKLIENSDEK